MYEQFFGLREAPFSLEPDPNFVFLSLCHRNALEGLTRAILSRKRFILMTGDAGTGRTTLIATALKYLPPARTRVGIILNPTLSAAEILGASLSAFGLTGVPASKARGLLLLERLLEKDERQGRITTLIIDEAQKLRCDALEEIRLLGNLDSLQIVLVGQRELTEMLKHEDLRALRQRITLRLSIEPLTMLEVAPYVSHRWAKAGGQPPSPFSREALDTIAQRSRGIPRLINTVCDNALMLAFQEQVEVVSIKHINEASATLDLSSPASEQDQGTTRC